MVEALLQHLPHHAALCQPLDVIRPEKHCIKAESDARRFHTFCNQVTKSAHMETYTCKSRELRHACQQDVRPARKPLAGHHPYMDRT